MRNPIKLTILILAVISLAACFNSTRTKYRTVPGPTTTVERDAPTPTPPEYDDNIFGPIADSVGLATVTRVQRNTGQTITVITDFNPHQRANIYARTQYTVGVAGTRNPNALAIRTEAQLYPRGGGDPMVFAAGGSSTLEFPGRGDVFRAVGFATDNDDGPGTRLTRQGSPIQASNWRNWENPVLTSFQFTRGDNNPSIIMNFGADSNGGAVFGDLESYAAKGGSEGCAVTDRNCNAPTAHDISIAFGDNRQRNPAPGALAYYWRALVPNHRLDKGTADDPAVLVAGETSTSIRGPSTFGPDIEYTVTEDVGSYTLELAHAATSIANSTNANEQRYLSYAAYGLFNFFDKYNTVNAPRTGALGRMQTISYGLDAFADAEGMRTTEAGTDIEATFKGRTMAYLVHLDGSDEADPAERDVTALTRMRGDISLTANIGPATNTITGSISGLEYYTSDTGQSSWRNSDITTGANTEGFSFEDAFSGSSAILNLTDGTIAEDGSYAGDITMEDFSGPDDFFDEGSFKGNLYGPQTGLETAGTWYLPALNAASGIAGVIGSFGACQDGKGRC